MLSRDIFFFFVMLVVGARASECPASVSIGGGDCVYHVQISNYVTLDSCYTFDSWLEKLANYYGGMHWRKPYIYGELMGPLTPENVVGTKRTIRIKGDNVKGRYKFKFKTKQEASDFKDCVASMLEALPMGPDKCCMVDDATSAPTSSP